MKLIIASNNKGKIREYKQLLEPLGYEVVSQRESGIDVDIDENGETFEENAAIKARAIYGVSKTATLADDSGIVIDALGGQPGVHSARYGTPDLDDEGRTSLVLKNMQGVPDEKRTARYVAVIHFIDKSGKEISVRGECEGIIGHSPVGKNGFGYDPIFIYGDKTFAQHTEEFKNSVSHRANALKQLIEKLKQS